MAFKAKELGLHVSSMGTGGILTYLGADDSAATIQGAAFWSTDLSSVENAEHKRARDAAEDFVAKQEAAPGTGVPAIVVGNDKAASGAANTGGTRFLNAYRHTDGRLRFR